MEPLPTTPANSWIPPLVAMRNGGYLTPKEVGTMFESRPTIRAIRKWMVVGVHNRKVKNGLGERIKLQHIREGAMMLTRAEWVQEFKDNCRNNVKSDTKAAS